MILKPSIAVVAARSLLATDVTCPDTPKTARDNSSVEAQWRLPQHAWDTHVHVFDPVNYAYSPDRVYTPMAATYESLLAFNSNISISHIPQNIVLIQPSPYGTNNSLVIDTLKRHAKNNGTLDNKLRAVAVVDESKVTNEQLSDWNEIGVRGFRVNLVVSANGVDYDELQRTMNTTAHRVKEFNWKCQLRVANEAWNYINETIRDLPVPVIADHLAGMKSISALPKNVTSVTEQSGFKSLISLAKSGKVFIKISGFYLATKSTTAGYDDLEPLIKAFAEEVPDQLIWGSDWPHVSANSTEETKYIPSKFRDIDDPAVLRNIRKWVGPQVWQRMMVDTPEKVYR